MLGTSKKLPVRSLLAAVALLGAAAVAEADNPVQMDIGSFSGFPTNPQTRFLDNIGNVTGSADPINGNISIVRTGAGTYNYTLFNNCVFTPSQLKTGTNLQRSDANQTTCVNWIFGDANVTTRIQAVSF